MSRDGLPGDVNGENSDGTFVCPICGARFDSTAARRRHVREVGLAR